MGEGDEGTFFSPAYWETTCLTGFWMSAVTTQLMTILRALKGSRIGTMLLK